MASASIAKSKEIRHGLCNLPPWLQAMLNLWQSALLRLSLDLLGGTSSCTLLRGFAIWWKIDETVLNYPLNWPSPSNKLAFHWTPVGRGEVWMERKESLAVLADYEPCWSSPLPHESIANLQHQRLCLSNEPIEPSSLINLQCFFPNHCNILSYLY